MKNILFTRELSQLDSAMSFLPSAKFNVIACPTIDIFPIKKTQNLAREFSEIFTSDHLIFTSKHAVIETMKYLEALGTKIAELDHINICAVGPMVAKQLTDYGIKVDMMPDTYSAKSLADLFDPVVNSSEKVFFPRGNLAAKQLSKSLSEKGYSIVSPIIYKTELRSALDKSAQALFDSNNVDCLVFTSPSSVQAMLAILNANKQVLALKQTLICAIGTTTKQACIENGLTVSIMPNEFTLSDVAKAIVDFYK